MDPKMRQGSRLKALGDIKDLMGEGEAERAKPFSKGPPPPLEGEPAHEQMELGTEMNAEAEGMPEDTDSPSELSPEDISKLKALLEVMK